MYVQTLQVGRGGGGSGHRGGQRHYLLTHPTTPQTRESILSCKRSARESDTTTLRENSLCAFIGNATRARRSTVDLHALQTLRRQAASSRTLTFAYSCASFWYLACSSEPMAACPHACRAAVNHQTVSFPDVSLWEREQWSQPHPQICVSRAVGSAETVVAGRRLLDSE